VIDHLDVCAQVRARALTTEVLSVTGSFEATATGYARAAGSFLTDGFEVGMEVSGVGWTNEENDAPKVVTKVEALLLTTAGVTVDADDDRVLSGTAGTVAEGPASRTLKVALPAALQADNERIVPGQGIPWWREEYSPGSILRFGVGTTDAFMQAFIDYFITLYLPPGGGPRAAHRYASAVLEHFPAGLVVALGDAETSCRVRGEPAPFFGQPFQSVEPHPGFFVVPFTVPLELWTVNS